MRNRYHSLLFLLAAFQLLNVPASRAQQPPGPLTLAECLRLAEATQSVLTLARQETEIAASGLNRARGAFLPQVHWNNAYTYNSPLQRNPSEFSFVALNGIREYNTQLTAVQELDTSGRIRADLQRARAEQDAAAASFGIARRDLRRAVSAAYFRVSLTRHLVRAAQDMLSEAQSFESRTRLLSEKGEVARADLYKASAQVAFLEQSLRSAELDAQVAAHQLAAFWTTDVSAPLEIVDELEQPLPAPESPQAGGELRSGGPLFLARPEFKLLEAQRRGFLADSRRARSEMLPQASFAFQYGIDSLQLRARDRGYAAFFNLNVPVFDWFRARRLSTEFRLRAQQVVMSREVAARAFSKEYQDALSRINLIYAQIALTEKQVQLSREGLRLSRLRYEGGEGPALDVLAAQNQLSQAHTNHFTVLANYLIARVDLEVAAGR